MSTEKVTKEVAEEEFERFAKEMDIAVPGPEAGDLSVEYDGARAVVLRCLRAGSMVVEDSGELTYTPELDKEGPLTFREPDGAAFMAMDRKKQGAGFAKMFAFLEAITGSSQKRFANMKRRDLTPCTAVALLFMG